MLAHLRVGSGTLAVLFGILSVPGAARAQDTVPPPPPVEPPAQVPAAPPPANAAPGQAPAQADIGALVRQMSEQVRRIGEDVSTTLQPGEARTNLIQDDRELAQALDEFYGTLRNKPDRFQLRQAYSGLDSTWHHLRARLNQPGVANFALERAARNADEIDTQLHSALGLKAMPDDYYADRPAAPTGIAETRRLARALDDRAAYLAAVVQADLVDSPDRARLATDAVNLVKASDDYLDAIRRIDRPEMAQNGFASLSATADTMERDLGPVELPPRAKTAWQAFATSYLLTRQQLGLPTPPPSDAPSPVAPANGPSPVVGLADQLLAQVDTFLQNFAPTVNIVPEGPFFLMDAQRLRDAAANFREDTARGLNPGQLAYEFREVDALWQRLARRVNRVARGRTGPNIQLAMQMGDTVAEIHRLLGMPGYPPVVTMPAAGPVPIPAPAIIPQ